MEIIFETLSAEHAISVMNIFNYYIENSFSAYPEKRLPNETFSNFLEISHYYPAYTVKSDDKVVGFCLLRPYNRFPVFIETAEVSYFIDKDYIGKGIGSKMLIHLEEAAMRMGVKKLLADISSRNEESIKFHLKHGFTQCGRFHNVGKKLGKHFDVVWMEKDLK